jgi:hypothetical protein
MKQIITPRLATLYNRCYKLQQEVVGLSGMSEDALADAYLELRECLAYWHSDHKDLAIEDPYEGLCLMMKDWKMPWPAMECSSLNGLKQSQFLLTFAYGEVEQALSVMVLRSVKGKRATLQYDEDDAACFALYAGKACVHAKQVIAYGKDGLAQHATDRKTA